MHKRLQLRAKRAVFLATVAAVAAVTVTLASVTVGNAAPATAPTITKQPFGSVGGQNVDIYTLTNAHQMEVKILTYGGIIQSVKVPDKSHQLANVTLGFPTLDDYVNLNSPFPAGGPYFGPIIGRYANRIAGGQFTLNGTTYQLALNNGPNTL